MFDDDWAGCSPFEGHVGCFEEVDIGRKWRLAAESFAHNGFQQGQVGGGQDVSAGVEGSERFTTADEDGRFTGIDNTRRAETNITRAAAWELLDDFVPQPGFCYYTIKNTSHRNSPLKKLSVVGSQ
jgi:hypothetical protein